MGSYSNGAAMNYVYYHYIKKSRSRYFGFLDHDVFPIHDFSILDQKTIFLGNATVCSYQEWILLHISLGRVLLL